ncbi:DUF1045 domain-containing protein [Nioella aestuarii]|uniref:DUF1045 domain-containing protein n=1 Tax=Nioella aestuarii TaxID=1662864 RepID=UPI003D7FD9B7
MTGYRRYSVFFVPEGAFYLAGASWLGWDAVEGQKIQRAEIGGLPVPIDLITEAPRRYGFHGTIKPPFRLADHMTEDDLRGAFGSLCTRLAPVVVPDLGIQRLGSFIAITPDTPCPALSDLAATVVAGLDCFRAPATEAELMKRRRKNLSARQEEMLTRWGYPYVFDEFRFHLTLTGKLGKNAIAVASKVEDFFTPVLPKPLVIDSLCLMGEGATGEFTVIAQRQLSGSESHVPVPKPM